MYSCIETVYEVQKIKNYKEERFSLEVVRSLLKENIIHRRRG